MGGLNALLNCIAHFAAHCMHSSFMQQRIAVRPNRDSWRECPPGQSFQKQSSFFAFIKFFSPKVTSVPSILIGFPYVISPRPCHSIRKIERPHPSGMRSREDGLSEDGSGCDAYHSSNPRQSCREMHWGHRRIYCRWLRSSWARHPYRAIEQGTRGKKSGTSLQSYCACVAFPCGLKLLGEFPPEFSNIFEVSGRRPKGSGGRGWARGFTVEPVSRRDCNSWGNTMFGCKGSL